MENIEETPDSDIPSENSQGVEAVEDLKMKERFGNIYENKGPLWKEPERSRNVIENKCSYTFNMGMLLKRKEVGGTQ